MRARITRPSALGRQGHCALPASFSTTSVSTAAAHSPSRLSAASQHAKAASMSSPMFSSLRARASSISIIASKASSLVRLENRGDVDAELLGEVAADAHQCGDALKLALLVAEIVLKQQAVGYVDQVTQEIRVVDEIVLVHGRVVGGAGFGHAGIGCRSGVRHGEKLQISVQQSDFMLRNNLNVNQNLNSGKKMFASQCRMARAALGLTVRQLAEQAQVSHDTIVRIEGSQGDLKASTVAKVQKALEALGIEFTMDKAGVPGVKHRHQEGGAVEAVAALPRKPLK